MRVVRSGGSVSDGTVPVPLKYGWLFGTRFTTRLWLRSVELKFILLAASWPPGSQLRDKKIRDLLKTRGRLYTASPGGESILAPSYPGRPAELICKPHEGPQDGTMRLECWQWTATAPGAIACPAQRWRWPAPDLEISCHDRGCLWDRTRSRRVHAISPVSTPHRSAERNAWNLGKR